MPGRRPFIDQDTGALDTEQIQTELYPLTGLVALFAGLALIPFIFVFVFAGNSALGALFTILTQFVLVIGTGIVLMYVIARGIDLSDV